MRQEAGEMQTVVNNYTINATGSAVVCGNSGSNLNVQNCFQFSAWGAEAARIIDSLSIRAQTAAMAYLYALEDSQAGQLVRG